jgi:hypothetical protein
MGDCSWYEASKEHGVMAPVMIPPLARSLPTQTDWRWAVELRSRPLS